MKKRLLSVALSLALAVSASAVFTGCTSRSEQLKLYSQGEYMDEDIFPEFEQWYLEKTGEKVKVSMNDFTSNEDMLTMIQKDRADYDLICPSDYMIAKMISEHLVQPIDKKTVDIAKSGLIKPEYLEITKNFDPDFTYSVPFMYGTFGIMYNYEKTGKHLDSWSSLFNEFDGEVYLKASARDTYAATSIYLKTEELSAASDSFTLTDSDAYRDRIQDIFEDTGAENENAVRSTLLARKNALKAWDDEQGKFQMALGNGTAGLFWSCDAGYVMNDYEDDNGQLSPGNKDLWYAIPKEGGNVYLDSFVIGKYAKNTKAANYFLQFLCRKEIAVRNSEYIGAVSPVAEAYDELYESMDADEDGFFNGAASGWKEMYLEMMFPSAATLKRCGQMVDYGADEGRILQTMADIIK